MRSRLEGTSVKPLHIVALFALYCAIMLTAGTVGWRQAVNAVTLPHVYEVVR